MPGLIPFTGGLQARIFLYNLAVDMRRSFDGLMAIVQSEFEQDVLQGDLFVFINKRKNRCRILYWERSGFVLWLKRLEKDRFAWPRAGEHDGVITLEARQLNLLLDGYDIWRMRPHQRLYYDVA